MIFNKNGEVRTPLLVIPINGRFILAIYQGKLSKFDLLIKYRQKNKNKWSNIRTPKHIHWAVDMLIKMHEDANSTKKFLDFLIGVWDKVKPLKNEQERTELLQLDKLIQEGRKEAKNYEKLGKKGEYSVIFLLLLAKLLMVQEKTNFESAYFFKKLLDALRSGDDIFRIVSLATHNGR